MPKHDLILAADCVYFEPAFPLLVRTLVDLVPDSKTEVLFCYKKRRKASPYIHRATIHRHRLGTVCSEDISVYTTLSWYCLTHQPWHDVEQLHHAALEAHLAECSRIVALSLCLLCAEH